MHRIALASTALVTLAFATEARADGVSSEPVVDRGYVALGGELVEIVSIEATIDAEAGIRIGTSPLLVHGLVGTGVSVDAEGSGSFHQARVGLEADHCSGTRRFCGFAGLDVGLRSSTWQDADADADTMTEESFGAFVMPRAGIDVGTELIRGRVTGQFNGTGGGVQLAIARRF